MTPLNLKLVPFYYVPGIAENKHRVPRRRRQAVQPGTVLGERKLKN
jgi:hypothetical protein